MKHYIKNMVCDRCILVVRTILDEAGIDYRNVQLGEVELVNDPDPEQEASLRSKLREQGFELLDDKRSALVSRIKTAIVQLIHREESEAQYMKVSVWLSDKLGMDYSYLSSLFSSIEGVTIEKYVILQRIEKAKELLLYDEMNLTEIADLLGYSSVQHLSQQFRKVTGLTPSHFRQLRENRRKPLDSV